MIDECENSISTSDGNFSNNEITYTPEDLVSVDENTNELYSTSLKIAEVTGIEHYVILRLINKILNDLPTNLAADSFIGGSYLDKNQQKRPMYKLN